MKERVTLVIALFFAVILTAAAQDKPEIDEARIDHIQTINLELEIMENGVVLANPSLEVVPGKEARLSIVGSEGAQDFELRITANHPTVSKGRRVVPLDLMALTRTEDKWKIAGEIQMWVPFDEKASAGLSSKTRVFEATVFASEGRKLSQAEVDAMIKKCPPEKSQIGGPQAKSDCCTVQCQTSDEFLNCCGALRCCSCGACCSP